MQDKEISELKTQLKIQRLSFERLLKLKEETHQGELEAQQSVFDNQITKNNKELEAKFELRFKSVNDRLEAQLSKNILSDSISSSPNAAAMLKRMDSFVVPRSNMASSRARSSKLSSNTDERFEKTGQGSSSINLKEKSLGQESKEYLRSTSSSQLHGELRNKGGRGFDALLDLEEISNEENECSIDEQLVQPSTSARKLEILLLSRLAASRENYDPSSTFQLSMDQLCSMMREKSGLIIYDVNGSAHSVSFKKDSVNNSLSFNVSMIHGPPGRRSTEECGMLLRSDNIFPRSRLQYKDFMREQLRHLDRRAASLTSPKDQLAYMTISDNIRILRRFDELFTRRIELVMGEWDMPNSHHVTQWAVLQHFLVVTWNTAMVRDDFNILTAEFDIRWTREFEMRTVVSHGKTVARIEECLKFLMYTCGTPTCGAWGMCNELCFYCKTSVTVSITTAKPAYQKGYQQSWQAYLNALGTNRASGTKDLWYATPEEAPFAPGAGNNTTSTPQTASHFSNKTEAYEFLETHQDCVVPHASRFRTSN